MASSLAGLHSYQIQRAWYYFYYCSESYFCYSERQAVQWDMVYGRSVCTGWWGAETNFNNFWIVFRGKGRADGSAVGRSRAGSTYSGSWWDWDWYWACWGLAWVVWYLWRDDTFSFGIWLSRRCFVSLASWGGAVPAWRLFKFFAVLLSFVRGKA